MNKHNATYLAKFVSIRWRNFENELATDSPLPMSVETANPHNGLHNFSPCTCLRFLPPSPRVCVPFLPTYFVEVVFVGPTRNIVKKYVSLCVSSFSRDVKVLMWSRGFKFRIYQIFFSFRNGLPKTVLLSSVPFYLTRKRFVVKPFISRSSLLFIVREKKVRRKRKEL